MIINNDTYLRKQQNALNVFTAKFMSNSKWVKLFRAISEHLDKVEYCEINSIYNSDRSQELEIPSSENFQDTFQEKGIRDVLIGGPILYKEIQSIRIYVKEPDSFEEMIQSLGEFSIERDSKFLIIYGYK
jgi:hypothetical protein